MSKLLHEPNKKTLQYEIPRRFCWLAATTRYGNWMFKQFELLLLKMQSRDVVFLSVKGQIYAVTAERWQRNTNWIRHNKGFLISCNIQY